jgi:hypothetical protein
MNGTPALPRMSRRQYLPLAIIIITTLAGLITGEQYRQLFESANDAIFLHYVLPDGRPGRYLMVNDIACSRTCTGDGGVRVDRIP